MRERSAGKKRRARCRETVAPTTATAMPTATATINHHVARILMERGAEVATPPSRLQASESGGDSGSVAAISGESPPRLPSEPRLVPASRPRSSCSVRRRLPRGRRGRRRQRSLGRASVSPGRGGPNDVARLVRPRILPADARRPPSDARACCRRSATSLWHCPTSSTALWCGKSTAGALSASTDC